MSDQNGPAWRTEIRRYPAGSAVHGDKSSPRRPAAQKSSPHCRQYGFPSRFQQDHQSPGKNSQQAIAPELRAGPVPAQHGHQRDQPEAADHPIQPPPGGVTRDAPDLALPDQAATARASRRVKYVSIMPSQASGKPSTYASTSRRAPGVREKKTLV